jgi:hypothetical protein
MNQRERDIIYEVGNILAAVKGVENPADIRGKTVAYDELHSISARASIFLHNLCSYGLSDEDTTESLELLRAQLRKVPRDHLNSFIVDRHPEWFGDD